MGVTGVNPWAIILCKFTDVAIPSTPLSYFTDFLKPGSQGLYDYWYDVAYGQIDLTGSKVFGWWTSQYTLVDDGNRPRSDFVKEARRLAAVNNVDLTKFYHIMCYFNANIDGGFEGDVNGGIGGQWGQSNWNWCRKCQGMVYSGAGTGPCFGGHNHDISGSQAYSLSLNLSAWQSSQDNWRWCKKCQGLNYGGNPAGPCPAGGNHDNSGSGDYAVRIGPFGPWWQDSWRWCKKCQSLAYSKSASPGSCVAGGQHDTSASEDYSVLVHANDFNLSAIAHEMGHAFNLQHSWRASPERHYGNPWDDMSAMTVHSISGMLYSPAGPGMDAANLDFLDVLNDLTTWEGPPAGSAGEQFQLLPLNQVGSKIAGYWGVARLPKGDRTYYVEFRQVSGWDRAIPRQAVFINEVRKWQHCRNCQELFAVAPGVAAGPCPAGGKHDDSGSSNYVLFRDIPAGASPPPTQNNWQWCNKCQALTYAGNPSPGVCPAGGQHSHQGSGNYMLVHDAPKYGQADWLWCKNCQVLNHKNSPAGVCKAGGTHDNSASLNYSVPINTRISFLLGDFSGTCDWQPGKVFIARETGMCVVVHGFAAMGAVPTVSVTVGDAQSDWALCSNCQGLFYSGIYNGVCPANGTGTHQVSGKATYSLLHDVHGSSGQDQWRWCNKCQGLAYAGGASRGVCPAHGEHNVVSDNYVLLHDISMADTQNDWRWCNKCQGIFYAGVSDGVCPAGGAHSAQKNDYNIINV